MTKELLKNIDTLSFEDAVKLLDDCYTERFTIKDYYNTYAYICDKFNYRSALLPHREYRQK